MRAGLALAILIGTTWTASAGDGFDIVIPGRPGVPVIINGIDASYAVVEGDWGLARPGHGTITVIGGTPIRPNPVYEPRNSYHPRYGRPPGPPSARHLRALLPRFPIVNLFDPIIDGIVFRVLRPQPYLAVDFRPDAWIAQIGVRSTKRRFAIRRR